MHFLFRTSASKIRGDFELPSSYLKLNLPCKITRGFWFVSYRILMGWGQNAAKQLPAKQAPGSDLSLISRSSQLQQLRPSFLSDLQGSLTMLLPVNPQLFHKKKSSKKAVTTFNPSSVVSKYNCIQIASPQKYVLASVRTDTSAQVTPEVPSATGSQGN